MKFSIIRIYDKSQDYGGTRLLVDRVWPRGVSKEQTRLYYWWKDVAPSPELRKWFNHDVAKWEDFKQRYRNELSEKKEEIINLVNGLDSDKSIVLLYSAKDENHNQAVVLQNFLEEIFC